MTTILCIESATEVCSIAIVRDGAVLGTNLSDTAFSHSAKLTVLIEETMQLAGIGFSELDAIAVSGGPGSYTGLRVGCSTGKGLCYALGIPYIHIDSLAILAASVPKIKNGVRIPMIDARRMEVYTSLYDSDVNQLATDSAVILDAEVIGKWEQEYEHIIYVGNGAHKVTEFCSAKSIIYTTSLHAEFMVDLAKAKFSEEKFENIGFYEPNYLKSPNVTVSKKALL